MLLGVFRAPLALASLTTAAVVYLSYGGARVTSLFLDGLPHADMMAAAGIELLIGGVSLYCLRHARTAGPS